MHWTDRLLIVLKVLIGITTIATIIFVYNFEQRNTIDPDGVRHQILKNITVGD